MAMKSFKEEITLSNGVKKRVVLMIEEAQYPRIITLLKEKLEEVSQQTDEIKELIWGDWKWVAMVFSEWSEKTASVYVDNKFASDKTNWLIWVKTFEKFYNNPDVLVSMYSNNIWNMKLIMNEVRKDEAKEDRAKAANSLNTSGEVDIMADALNKSKWGVSSEEINKLLNSVDVSSIISENKLQSVIAVDEFNQKYAKELQDLFNVSDFNNIQQLNETFESFLGVDDSKRITQDILSQLDGDTAKQLLDLSWAKEVANNMNAISTLFKLGDITGNIWNKLRFWKGKWAWSSTGYEAFLNWLRTELPWYLAQINLKLTEDANKLDKVILLTKEHLPKIASQIVRISYVEKTINAIIANKEKVGISDDVRNTLMAYLSNMMLTKQMLLTSVVKIIGSRTTMISAKQNNAFTQMRLNISVSWMVLDSVIQIVTSSVQKSSKLINEMLLNWSKSATDLMIKNQKEAEEIQDDLLKTLRSFGPEAERLGQAYESHKTNMKNKIDEIRKFKDSEYQPIIDKLEKVKNARIEDAKDQRAANEELRGMILELEKGVNEASKLEQQGVPAEWVFDDLSKKLSLDSYKLVAKNVLSDAFNFIGTLVQNPWVTEPAAVDAWVKQGKDFFKMNLDQKKDENIQEVTRSIDAISVLSPEDKVKMKTAKKQEIEQSFKALEQESMGKIDELGKAVKKDLSKKWVPMKFDL